MIINIFLATAMLYWASWLFVLTDDSISHIIYCIQDKYFPKPLKRGRRFTNAKKTFGIILRRNFVVEMYFSVYRFFDFIKKSPVLLYKETKYFMQRGINGYSDRDLWSVNYYLSNTIPKMLKDLKERQHILPGWDFDKEQEEVAQKRWYSYIDDMVYTFETAVKMYDGECYYQESGKYSIKKANDYNKEIQKYEFKKTKEALTKEECKRYENGWFLFRKHFFSLWD